MFKVRTEDKKAPFVTVVLDTTGYSKGYGFIRFLEEREQQSALSNMMGATGLGTKPLKVSMAVPKGPREDGGGGGGGRHRDPPTAAPTDSSADYSQYWQNQYSQYWSQYAAWSQYYDQQQQQSSYYA